MQKSTEIEKIDRNRINRPKLRKIDEIDQIGRSGSNILSKIDQNRRKYLKSTDIEQMGKIDNY